MAKNECVNLLGIRNLEYPFCPTITITLLYYYGINRIPNSILQTPSQLHTLAIQNTTMLEHTQHKKRAIMHMRTAKDQNSLCTLSDQCFLYSLNTGEHPNDSVRDNTGPNQTV